MAGLGRVGVGGKDRGAGFALGPRLVVTAHHIVRGRGDKPVVYVPAGGEAVEVERIQADADHDAAILWLVGDVAEFLPTSVAVRGAGWRVESPPGGNDPQLHGTVTTARMVIQNADGQPVEVVQLEVGEQLGDFGGYSGSAVLDSLGRAVLALLVEQKPLRTPAALVERRAASNVLYAVPIGDVITMPCRSVMSSPPMACRYGHPGRSGSTSGCRCRVWSPVPTSSMRLLARSPALRATKLVLAWSCCTARAGWARRCWRVRSPRTCGCGPSSSTGSSCCGPARTP